MQDGIYGTGFVRNETAGGGPPCPLTSPRARSIISATSGEKCDGHGIWLFCPKCGTQLCWKGNTGEEIDIFASTLNDTRVFQTKE